MILWNYHCNYCQFAFEELSSEGEKIMCPQCQEIADKVLLSFTPSVPQDAKMNTLSIKFRDRTNYYKNMSKEERSRH
jgi:DNA-directed RNA polymerase subunit RPC12/RpoP